MYSLSISLLTRLSVQINEGLPIVSLVLGFTSPEILFVPLVRGMPVMNHVKAKSIQNNRIANSKDDEPEEMPKH